jgi:cell division septation protein DedD
MASDNQPVPERVPANDDLTAAIRAEHESISRDIRQRVLERDRRCQVSGCHSPNTPDSPGLLVQRIADDPTYCDRDDPANLVARCPRCARWIAQMPSRDDLPAVLRGRLNGVDLKSSRVEILNYLYREGPASTGEITDHVSGLSSTVSVRRALYDLMCLDVRSPEVEDRLVAKDIVAKQYGMPWAVDDDREARGSLPVRPATRRIRILDALVARLLDELTGQVDNPRQLVATIVDRDVSQTHRMERRAQAFQFPIEQWIEPNRSLPDELAAVEAVDVLAQVTENVSRRRVAAPLADLLERDDEDALATLLRQQFLADERTSLAEHRPETSSESIPGSDTQQPQETATGQPTDDPSEPELHVFDDAEAGEPRPHDTDGHYPTEDDYGQ